MPGTALAADCRQDYTDADDVIWDIDSDGSILESGSDAYDGYGDLTVLVGPDSTPYSPTDIQACTYEDGARETAYPREASSGGLQVARKLYVPSTGLRFARILDIVSNPTAAPITARLEFTGNYGTDNDTQVLATSSGDTTVDVGDAWTALDEDDGQGSKIASLWDSASAAKADAADDFPERPASETAPGADDGEDAVTVVYDGIAIEPAQTVIYMHVEHTGGSRRDVREFADSYEAGSEEFYSGLSAEERSQLRNWTPESDQDQDGRFFSQDNCPVNANADQADNDRDGPGDACDADDDNDGLSDGAEGELGLDPKNGDTDGDGLGDRVDACPRKAGTSSDGCPEVMTAGAASGTAGAASGTAGAARPPKGVSARVTPGRDTRPPHRFRISGAVTPPDGVTVTDACAGGAVRVSAKAGRNTIATRQADLRPDCTYSVRMSFTRPRRFGNATRLRFVARFLGNARVTRGSSPVVNARVR